MIGFLGFAFWGLMLLLVGCVIVVSSNEKEREDEEQMHWIKNYQEN